MAAYPDVLWMLSNSLNEAEKELADLKQEKDAFEARYTERTEMLFSRKFQLEQAITALLHQEAAGL